MDKLIYYNELFDIYSKLLTDNQRELFSLYYEENLSLQEIAEHKGVSRSFVSKSINGTADKLDEYEDALGILLKKEKIDAILKLNSIEEIKSELERL